MLLLVSNLACQQSRQATAPPTQQSAQRNGEPLGHEPSAEQRDLGPPQVGQAVLKDARIDQEVLLHAALYRAAYESNVGDFTRHFLLEPIAESDPPNLNVDPIEFRQRVLAELKDLKARIDWMPQTWQSREMDYFPGTNELATRLGIKITKRDENQATVIGEVSDWTASVGSSRQGVTATWDGVKWNIERDRVRLVW